MSAAHPTLKEDSASSGEEDDDVTYPQLNDDLSMPGSQKKMIKVVVTGFGPFSGHLVNASWEAVKGLKKTGVAHNVDLVTIKVPTVYHSVQTAVSDLWKEHNPDLVVHVGVSSVAEEITVETQAHNEGYESQDFEGKYAPSQCYSKGTAGCLRTSIDVHLLCIDVNESSCLAMAVPSADAGLYLCEYIYYGSLCHSTSSVIFIHVPAIDQPYTASELSDALKCTILSILKQLDLYHPLPLPDQQLLDQIQQQTADISDRREISNT